MSEIAAQDASVANKKAQESELVALKQQMDKLKNVITPGPDAKKKLRKACTDFEAVFISKLWEQMRATVPKSGMFNSQQEEMYRSMFDREFTEKMAQDGGIGLGDMLYDQLKNKIKGGGKMAGTSGAQTLQSGLANAPIAEPGTTGALPEKQEFKVSGRRNAASAQNTASATTQPSASAALAPQPPASVSGAVMADVETLARRIEADYDRRQALAASGQGAQGHTANGRAARYGQDAGAGAVSAGSRFATTG